MAKVDWNGNGKADFSINPAQLFTAIAMIFSIAGSYYTLNSRLDAVELATKKLKENQEKYTWPNLRKLEEDVQEMRVEFKAVMKDIEYSMEKIDALRIQLNNKRDKK